MAGLNKQAVAIFIATTTIIIIIIIIFEELMETV